MKDYFELVVFIFFVWGYCVVFLSDKGASLQPLQCRGAPMY